MRGCRRRVIRAAVLAFIVICFVAYCRFRSPHLSGTVVSVIDGDTIDVKHSSLLGAKIVRIRLATIDAPERGQPYWRTSRDFVAQRVAGREVNVETGEKDRYGRVVGDVYYEANGADHLLNEELVSVGLAWWFKEYSPDNHRLASMQEQAQRERVGMWADPEPTAPWEFRARKRSR